MKDLHDQEEADHNCFFTIYWPTLNALASDPQTACTAKGNYNTPWEIQDELIGYGYLANSTALALDAEQRDGMLKLADALKQLPPDAIAPKGAIMTSPAGCLQAMQHPAWEPLRKDAVHLAEILEPVFDRTEDFFYPD